MKLAFNCLAKSPASILCLTTFAMLTQVGCAPSSNSAKSAVNSSVPATRLLKTQALGGPTSIVYSGPLHITQGGTYSGNFKGTDTEPAIWVDTPDPVIIQNCNLTGPSDLIRALWTPDLIVKNCNGYVTDPTASGAEHGRFLTSAGAKRLWVFNNYMENAGAGIYAYQFQGNGTVGSLKVLRNVSKNINAKRSDGTYGNATFFQINQMFGVPGAEIAWNQDINEPNLSSAEDNINLYRASGTPSNPILIHDNYVQGAYPVPANGPNFSGTGMTTDADTSGLNIPAYIDASNNQFISTCDAAMNNAQGHDIHFHDNRMISSGLFADGSRVNANWAATSIYDGAGVNPPVTNNLTDNNVIGYVAWGGNVPSADRRDLSPQCVGCVNNTSLPGPITLETEKNEWVLWNRKLTSNQIKIGSDLNYNMGSQSVNGADNYEWGTAGAGAPTSTPTSTPTSRPTSTPTPTATATSTPTSGASQLSLASSGLCIDVVGSSVSDGAVVQQATCNGNANQKFILESVGNGQYHVHGQQSDKCLDVYNASTASGAAILQYSCGMGTNQLFVLSSSVSGGSALVSVNSGLCVAASGASSSAGAALVQSTCTGAAEQSWISSPFRAPAPAPTATQAPAPPVSGVFTILRSVKSSRCVDVNNASTANSVALQQWDCGGASNQLFAFQSVGSGKYRIVGQNSGKCFDVRNASKLSGAVIQQYTCGGGSNQLFTLKASTGGGTSLISVSSGKCLSVSGGSLLNGAGIVQNTCNGSAAQSWLTQ